MEGSSSFKVKKEASAFAAHLSDTFSESGRTNLDAICADEGLPVIVDNYRGYFDGMLVWDGRCFNIHLDSSKGNTLASRRGRFTLAHELGHYFIESHREGIRAGVIPSHPSSHSVVHSDRMELEADYFASNLLMPKDRFRMVSSRTRIFSLDVIRGLSDYFDTSLTATILRFVDVGTHEIMVVFSQENKVRWSQRSEDFPKLSQKFRTGGPLPPTTAAGEYYSKPEAQYTTVEKLDLEDWFEYRGWDPGRQLYEQCFYSDLYNFVISVIWFE
jgi:Zn-dependent peptidase ImmA (M78 family)